MSLRRHGVHRNRVLVLTVLMFERRYMNITWIKLKGEKFGTLTLYTDKKPFTVRKYFCEPYKSWALRRLKRWIV